MYKRRERHWKARASTGKNDERRGPGEALRYMAAGAALLPARPLFFSPHRHLVAETVIASKEKANKMGPTTTRFRYRKYLHH